MVTTKHAVAFGLPLNDDDCLTSEVESILPNWVPWTRALVSIPLGVVIGGWLRVRRS